MYIVITRNDKSFEGENFHDLGSLIRYKKHLWFVTQTNYNLIFTEVFKRHNLKLIFVVKTFVVYRKLIKYENFLP